ncbi:MAG: phenylalanine--tRNA ligase subunit alpha, partial [Bacteroidales bacterium]|nr:phenylalanine--tRNA ligase subunit alpha [Bacteroidales bacterium]
MKEKIVQLRKEVEQYVIGSADQLEQFRLTYLSKKGVIPSLFEGFREVPPEQKKEIGLLLNELKQLASDRYSEFKEGFSYSESASAESDLTRPAVPFARGSRHPISIVRTEIIDIFSKIGFTVSEGPEIEDDNHVFSKLNFPRDHPARDMQDTFYITRASGEDSDPHDVLLRTHTSSVQVRVME